VSDVSDWPDFDEADAEALKQALDRLHRRMVLAERMLIMWEFYWRVATIPWRILRDLVRKR
jgi:hypothetical protein